MGKKSKVDTAPVAVVQSGKKGKRGAEDALEKVVNAKKQKVENKEEKKAAVSAPKKKELKKPPPKESSSSSSESDSDSEDSDDEPKNVKKTQTATKNGAVAVKNTKQDSSSDDSDSDSSDSDEEPAATKQNGSVVNKKSVSSDSSDSESDSDVSDGKAAAPAVAKNTNSSSDSSDESSEGSSDSDDEKAAPVQNKPTAKPAVADSDSDDSSDDSSDDESEDSTDESGDEEPAKAKVVKKDSDSSESSEDDESSDSDEESDKPSLKTPKKKDEDEEMVDAEGSKPSFQKTPKTPATPQATGSKTLFVGNLSFDVQESDVREFFKSAGEIADIRFASNPEGQFRGFGHIEFQTAEAAQKALELHEQPLLGRPVRLDLARERDGGSFTPQSRDNSSFQRGNKSQGQAQGQTVFVKGFDPAGGEDEIRSALQEHFGDCGETTRVSIPRDFDTGSSKGIAYIDFASSDGFNKALQMDSSDMGGYTLYVQEAKPRGDSRGGDSGGRFSGRGGRDGGRFSSRGGRDGGRFSGRGGRDGGRFSGRGGRDGGRGGRGRGPPITAAATGKKTTFADDD